eukprot:c43711_g1_i1 orf=3-305(-)
MDVGTECYLKMNCYPYLLQVDLCEDVETSKSSVVIDQGVVRISLVKGKRKTIDLRKEEELKQEREVVEQWHRNLNPKPSIQKSENSTQYGKSPGEEVLLNQ